MAWRRPGNKPLSEPMMITGILLMHICVIWPQRVKQQNFKLHLWKNTKIMFYNNSIFALIKTLVQPDYTNLNSNNHQESKMICCEERYTCNQFYLKASFQQLSHQKRIIIWHNDDFPFFFWKLYFSCDCYKFSLNISLDNDISFNSPWDLTRFSSI